MSVLHPQPPFVWPEPRAIEKMSTYEQPPFGELALGSRSLFGIVSALTARGVEAIAFWLERNPGLRASLVVTLYPACATRQADLAALLDLVGRTSDRLSVHLRPLERITDRATNALCFLAPGSDAVHIVTGPSEDLGLEARQDSHVNFVFRADPALVEAFRRYFDWLWIKSPAITEKLPRIPHLVLPEGTDEEATLWRAYVKDCLDLQFDEEDAHAVAHIDPVTGDITISSQDGQAVQSPTEELGLAKLDQLAEQMARVYSKGAMVSIDKLSRIPPLDAPLNPSLFGDVSEFHKGNVTRKVSMRASVIDEKALKDIDRRRQGLRMLLTKFSFGLADNTRWMPATARELFESELKSSNEEGQKLIANLLNGTVDQFIIGKRAALVADINAMYAELGRPGQVTDDVIIKVVENLKDRLTKAQSANFMPKLSYSMVSFVRTDNALISPWGQAFSLLSDIVTFPRKALTNAFFLRGLNVGEDDLIEAMNVADDALCRDLRVRGIKDRCKAELALLSRIEKAPMEARDRCELVSRILGGDSNDAVNDAVMKKEVA
jgi:hypothetical protein